MCCVHIRSLCNVTKQQKAILLKTEQKYIHKLKPVNVGFTKKKNNTLLLSQSCMTFFSGQCSCCSLLYNESGSGAPSYALYSKSSEAILMFSVLNRTGLFEMCYLVKTLPLKSKQQNQFYSWDLCCLMKCDHKRAPLDHFPSVTA